RRQSSAGLLPRFLLLWHGTHGRQRFPPVYLIATDPPSCVNAADHENGIARYGRYPFLPSLSTDRYPLYPSRSAWVPRSALSVARSGPSNQGAIAGAPARARIAVDGRRGRERRPGPRGRSGALSARRRA